MEDRTLLVIALFSCLFGIAALFTISQLYGVEELSLQRIDSIPAEETIQIRGTILRVEERGNAQILTISRQESVEVVLFSGTEVPVNTGDNVRVVGKVEEYQGRKEIIADSVTKT